MSDNTNQEIQSQNECAIGLTYAHDCAADRLSELSSIVLTMSCFFGSAQVIEDLNYTDGRPSLGLHFLLKSVHRELDDICKRTSAEANGINSAHLEQVEALKNLVKENGKKTSAKQ